MTYGAKKCLLGNVKVLVYVQRLKEGVDYTIRKLINIDIIGNLVVIFVFVLFCFVFVF